MGKTERFTFANRDGEQLAARLDLPDGRPRAFALFAHCFACSKDALAAARISRALSSRGFGVLRFDFTGLGSSEGEFANTTFSSNVDDLVAAAQWLSERHGAPKLLIGHSLGGAAVLAAAHRLPEVAAIATINAPSEPAHLARLLQPARAEIEARGEAEVRLAGRSFTIKKQFLEDLAQQGSAERIGQLGKALLIFHAPRDEQVGIENASKIFLAAKHPKSFVSLDDADHLLTRPADAAYVAEVLAAWAVRYLPGPVPEETDELRPGPKEVVVAETGEGRFAQTVRSGRHILGADEPAEFGGDDSGPGPYHYLLAALGACTAMTLRMYAEHKSLPLTRVVVRLKHDRIHAVDCEECETKEGKLDEITREVTVEGDLDDAQRQRLLEIADRCPVHRTLTSEIRIRTRLVE